MYWDTSQRFLWTITITTIQCVNLLIRGQRQRKSCGAVVLWSWRSQPIHIINYYSACTTRVQSSTICTVSWSHHARYFYAREHSWSQLSTLNCAFSPPSTGHFFVGHMFQYFDRSQSIVEWCLLTIFLVLFFILIAYFNFELNSRKVLPSATFWASRGHGCLPISSPCYVRAFILIAHRFQHSHFSASFFYNALCFFFIGFC